MEHSTVGKLTRRVALSMLALAMASGMTGLRVVAANPAVIQSDGPGGNSALASSSEPPTPTPAPIPL
jgi:hypothetical protein